MARPSPDLSRFSRETVEAAIATYGVMRGAQHLRISYRHLADLRKTFQIPRQVCYSMQRLVLLALSACPGSTAQEIRAWINTHQDRHRFRQAIWEACQKLCYDGLIRKEGSGLQTRYWRVDEGENHGTSPSVD